MFTFFFQGSVHRYSNVYEYVMSQPNVVTRVNNLVQSLERPYIDLTGSGKITGKLEFNIIKVEIYFYTISKG